MGNGCCVAGPEPLFARIGGQPAVNAVVDKFYMKLAVDPLLEGIFRPFDIEQLKDHQRKFIAMALGGPVQYTGRSLRRAHARINNGRPPKETHFARVAELLQETLQELNVPQGQVEEIMATVSTTKDDVLNLA